MRWPWKVSFAFRILKFSRNYNILLTSILDIRMSEIYANYLTSSNVLSEFTLQCFTVKIKRQTTQLLLQDKTGENTHFSRPSCYKIKLLLRENTFIHLAEPMNVSRKTNEEGGGKKHCKHFLWRTHTFHHETDTTHFTFIYLIKWKI